MSVLVSSKFADELRGYKLDSQVSEIFSLLENMDYNSPSQMHNVKIIDGEKQSIYVLKHKNWRVFFTKQENDIVLLSITDSKVIRHFNG
ncbi:hypothetical protein [Vibrio porteresiae]|uniref:Type II toxin-antitoxin system RelE/ParE family toxin n=1 Tax=Vibrio porteresiae DSM 19223 TaxID=1123496 RepID=A0ABZ0QBX9_9VIBR|nr:hypothetical protein [Vibrio porteresiae]WPC73958.1 hypothetical protein R8Z52_01330 [Vibrio porteresiae DSM 19223]